MRCRLSFRLCLTVALAGAAFHALSAGACTCVVMGGCHRLYPGNATFLGQVIGVNDVRPGAELPPGLTTTSAADSTLLGVEIPRSDGAGAACRQNIVVLPTNGVSEKIPGASKDTPAPTR